MSSKDNLALDLEHGVRRWDRSRWISVFSSHNPTIREVTECLGLGLSASSSTTNRGIPKFDNPDYRKLSSEVTRLSKALPKERDALLDFAADPHSLNVDLDELLATYGPAIWGKDADRTCLLTPDSTKKTYTKDLFYDDPEHKEILRTHLHRWIVIKACYYIRNMKLKRPSGTSEYDTLADIDGDSQLSPRGTPNSLSTPEADTSAGAEYEVKPVNYKKRKNEAVGSFSDGEEHPPSPAKRPYSTMPIKRTSQSPRKSLHNVLPGGLGSMENVPPLPSPKHHLSPSPSNGVDSGRIQLSPVSGNELNGAARPTSSAASTTPNGFTAVNGGFTAVNGTPPKVADPVREVARVASPESQRPSTSHQHRDSRSYTSPYEAASNATAAERLPDSRSPLPPSSVPTIPPPSTQGFQPVNTPAVANGTSDREASKTSSVHSAPSPPPGASPTHSDQLAKTGAQRQSAPPVQPPSHTPSQPQNPRYQRPRPPSRTNTPGNQSFGRPPISHKSYTPTAPGASTQPAPASNTQAAPGPALQTAPTYGMTLVPTHPHPTTPNNHAQLPHKAHQHHHQPQPPRQPVLLSQPVEAAMPHHPTKKPTISEHEFRLLQCQTTTALLQYFFPRTTPLPDESAILHTIHHLWYHGEPYFRPELGTTYDPITFVLTSWIQERAAISGLQHHLSVQPGLPLSSPVLVDRLLAMNDIRVMRLKWKNMSTVDGVSPEDLLVRAFMTISGTEGTEFLWKEGLRGAERGVFEWLKGEDVKMRIGMFKR